MSPEPNGAQLTIPFEADLARVGEQIEEVLAFTAQHIRRRTQHQEVLGQIRLALYEAMTNVIRHAVAGRADAVITMTVDVGCADVRYTIEDNGIPLDLEKARVAAMAPDISSDVDALPEGGFGWFLIHQEMTDVSYERVDGWNRTRMRKCLR